MFALLCGACARELEPSRRAWLAGPDVLPVDSVLLAESDGIYLGNPFSLLPDTSDGSFLISDFFEDRILRYDRDGRFRQMYGRPGPGPGEFLDISAAFQLNDTLVVGADDRRRLLHLFHRDDGRHLASYRYTGRLGMGRYNVLEDGVVMPSRHIETLTTVAVWRYPGQGIDHVVPLPKEYVRSALRRDGAIGRFAAFHSPGSVVAWSDTLLAAMSGLNQIFVAKLDGSILDTLSPPPSRRRGVPSDIQQTLDDPMFGEPYEASSMLTGLHRLSTGETVVFHHDEVLVGEQPHGTVKADIWVTVISADRKKACVDGLVPHSREMRPIHSVAQDTIFLLDRRLNEAEDALDSWVRLYRIDTSGCTWVDAK